MSVSSCAQSFLSAHATYSSSCSTSLSSPLSPSLITSLISLQTALLTIAQPTPTTSTKKKRTFQTPLFKHFNFPTTTQSKTVRELAVALTEIIGHREMTCGEEQEGNGESVEQREWG